MTTVLLVEETGVPGENLPQITDKLYHITLYRVPCHDQDLNSQAKASIA